MLSLASRGCTNLASFVPGHVSSANRPSVSTAGSLSTCLRLPPIYLSTPPTYSAPAAVEEGEQNSLNITLDGEHREQRGWANHTFTMQQTRPLPPLPVAAARGDIDALTALLAEGIDINGTSRTNPRTSLMEACKGNADAAVDFLIAQG